MCLEVLPGYEAWPHQVEALERAVRENIILNLPTGTGKTLVACMLLDWFKAPGYVSVFVVNSRALVTQQAEYLKKHSLNQLAVGDLGPPHPDVVVATGEVVRSALESGQLQAQQLACVVLDEVHYAVGKHPYAEIMALLCHFGASPRLLGLTASFFHGRAKTGCERRLEALEELLSAKVHCPEVQGGPSTSACFFSVPWSAKSFGLQEMAALEEKFSRALVNLEMGCALASPYAASNVTCTAGTAAKSAVRSTFGAENWEFQKVLESETPRLRGVLEAIGPAGWYGFVCYALPEVMMAKLQSKLAIMEDEVVKSNLLNAIALVRPFQLALMQGESVKELQQMEAEQAEQHITGKCQTLLTLLEQLLRDGEDKILVFVERVSVACCMARLISSRLGVLALHVAGVQGMDGPTRQSNLASFRGETQLLVATSSLEEGLDVPMCRYVIRYDSFNSAKSHVQGAGRARHPDARVYYFENDPLVEEGSREFLESIARRECVEPKDLPADAKVAVSHRNEESPGVGVGHKWSIESTLWDYQSNKSFRGMTCPCGARMKITSRAYGQGRKKKERSFCVEGPRSCPTYTEELDARFQGVDPTTGILR
ncbi:Endoribonuclease Dicer homolog 2 (Dicer-like protein 2) (AtDCL2) [Durusdinium trenchii]|uniref:Endoribonuclease Dicer homolog 2 (Dicer-like protein 2) (AtDCL2) n=1 Tax=Durusdinium trenchii TaxID=1381693 RepID=A0ABP0RB57_9DINO